LWCRWGRRADGAGSAGSCATYGGIAGGAGATGFWYLSRASGVVAYALVWYSMALGLLITTGWRASAGRPATFDLHTHVSLLGLGFSIFHMLVLLGDPKIHSNVNLLLVPSAVLLISLCGSPPGRWGCT